MCKVPCGVASKGRSAAPCMEPRDQLYLGGTLHSAMTALPLWQSCTLSWRSWIFWIRCFLPSHARREVTTLGFNCSTWIASVFNSFVSEVCKRMRHPTHSFSLYRRCCCISACVSGHHKPHRMSSPLLGHWRGLLCVQPGPCGATHT